MPNAPPKYRPTAPRREQRPSAHARGYDHRWERFRLGVLGDVGGVVFPEGGPLCRDCLDEGRVTEATEVDHKVTLAERPDLKYEPSNMRSLCKPHHSRKTQRYDR